MRLSKATIYLNSHHNSLAALHPSSPSSTSPSPLGPPRPSKSSKATNQLFYPPLIQQRQYAQAADAAGDLHWPKTPSIHAIPSPYQIFALNKGDAYSKERFYRLVKLYHPDCHGHHYAERSRRPSVSQSIKLERFRLVVAANEILSDPVKRRAYDRFGAGWNGQPAVTWPKDPNAEPVRNSGGAADGGWNNDPPDMNATWEDWERWYERQRNTKGPQSPIYFSHGACVSLIVFLAAMGWMAQTTRVGTYSMSLVEQRQQVNVKVGKELSRRRRNTSGSGDRGERVDTFLKTRDPLGYGVTDPVEEDYRRLLPFPELCLSGEIKARRMDNYRDVQGDPSRPLPPSWPT